MRKQRIAVPIEERFWRKVSKSVLPNGCWEWTGSTYKNGYGRIGSGRRPSKDILVHRLSWKIHFESDPGDLDVCHTCDNRICVRPDHFFLGTSHDNHMDASRKGRLPSGSLHHTKLKPERIIRGEKRWTSKLTDAQVLEIRDRYVSSKVSQRSLGMEYNISQGAVGKIIRRECWQHLLEHPL